MKPSCSWLDYEARQSGEETNIPAERPIPKPYAERQTRSGDSGRSKLVAPPVRRNKPGSRLKEIGKAERLGKTIRPPPRDRGAGEFQLPDKPKTKLPDPIRYSRNRTGSGRQTVAFGPVKQIAALVHTAARPWRAISLEPSSIHLPRGGCKKASLRCITRSAGFSFYQWQ